MIGLFQGLKIGSGFLDLLYPSGCALCNTSLAGAASLCDECADSLPRLRTPFCTNCGECHDGRIDSAFDCINCASIRFAFDFARPVLRRDPRSLDLVHRFKYGRQIHLASTLGALTREALDDPRFHQALAEKWPLVPVPLHPSRMRKRHFNQAHELAQTVAALTDLPLLHCLQRVRATGTQTALGRKARQKNLKGAFRIGRHLFRPLPIPENGAILVDDVFTTGSTLHECAATLRKAGCPSVIAITLLRG
jgi:ComF family protein